MQSILNVKPEIIQALGPKSMYQKSAKCILQKDRQRCHLGHCLATIVTSLVMPNNDPWDIQLGQNFLAYLMKNKQTSKSSFGQGQKYLSDPDVLTLVF